MRALDNPVRQSVALVAASCLAAAITSAAKRLPLKWGYPPREAPSPTPGLQRPELI